MAQLEPSVQVRSTTNPGILGNNFQQVLFGGAYFRQTRIAVDGSIVGDRLIGGTIQNFSQESVQEFQVSTFNIDVSTGVGASGTINIVTVEELTTFGAGLYTIGIIILRRMQDWPVTRVTHIPPLREGRLVLT